jgi:methionyl-tRNA formyltransferase
LRVAFAGTPAFAATALEAIAGAGHVIPIVFTQPDRPAGRGMRLVASAVAEAAGRLGLAVAKPVSFRDALAQQALRDANAEVMVVAAYGLLLPGEALAIPARGCINIHASLLPRWRGAAPIQRSILAGDEMTGVSLMQMDAGLDTGPVFAMEAIPIAPQDTTGTLTAALARLGARLVVANLASPEAWRPLPQDPVLATHAPKVSRKEAVIDWTQPAAVIERRVRAFNPAPGAETRIRGETLKIWEAAPAADSGTPGAVIACDAHRVLVGCGSGSLELRRVQRPGGKAIPATDFARGARLAVGAVFDPPAEKEPAPPVSR